MYRLAVLLLLLSVLLPACERRAEVAAPPPAAAVEESQLAPPAPPLLETFDGEPQLSLFPRIGAFLPDDDDEQGGNFWLTYVDHLLRTSGAVLGAGRDGGRAWSLRSLGGVDSVGFFSPLAVAPATTYRVRFAFRGELPAGGSAGIGILEFDEFLWIGEQYPRKLHEQHQTGVHAGVRLEGSHGWGEHQFDFTTSARTHMVHLILFRDGEPDRQQPVYFDDILIEARPATATGH